jgi:hypothetical protein
MTTTTDLNRLLWQERAAGDSSRPWESLTTEPEGIREEPVQLHTFQMAAGHSAVADDAIARAGAWLRRTLSS